MLRSLFVSLLLLLLAPAPSSGSAGDLLEPDAAFRFSARLIPSGSLEVSYRIADGYYLYKERFRFSIEPASVRFGLPGFPAGQWHEDEFFGRSEVYRGNVTIVLPLLSMPPGSKAVRLSATSQGCADVGVCYLPDTQTADLILFGLGGDPASVK